MIVYKDRAFCMQDCGRNECIRNKANIPWDNDLPVSFIKGVNCVNHIPLRNRTDMGDFFVKEGDE